MKSKTINTINMVINYNNNNNNNMRRDGGTLISIDDFDIDYSVFPISNRQIDSKPSSWTVDILQTSL